ncbi:hypothetical protein VaNZ11_002184, partial [Volvox africanus]
TNSSLLTHPWIGYFSGPVDWSGLRVVAHQPGSCSVPQGSLQNCHATVLCNLRAKLTEENCYDKYDNDNDGRVDKDDPDCWRCGDGGIDPNEQCDDFNILDGDDCTSTCNLP